MFTWKENFIWPYLKLAISKNITGLPGKQCSIHLPSPTIRLNWNMLHTWCCRRLLRVPWTARRSNQSILKEISPGCSLEGLILKLKLQYFGQLITKSWLTGKDPDAGRDWGQEEKGTTEDEMAGRHHRLDGHEFEYTPGVGDGQGGLAFAIHGAAKSRTRLSDWTELNWTYMPKSSFVW